MPGHGERHHRHRKDKERGKEPSQGVVRHQTLPIRPGPPPTMLPGLGLDRRDTEPISAVRSGNETHKYYRYESPGSSGTSRGAPSVRSGHETHKYYRIEYPSSPGTSGTSRAAPSAPIMSAQVKPSPREIRKTVTATNGIQYHIMKTSFGEGTYSRIWKCARVADGKAFACKEMTDRKAIEATKEEVDILKRVTMDPKRRRNILTKAASKTGWKEIV